MSTTTKPYVWRWYVFDDNTGRPIYSRTHIVIENKTLCGRSIPRRAAIDSDGGRADCKQCQRAERIAREKLNTPTK